MIRLKFWASVVLNWIIITTIFLLLFVVGFFAT